MIARGKSDHAASALVGRKLQQPIGRAAKLERAAGLQAFAFQPDANPADLAVDQRGSLDQPGDTLRGLDHVVSRKLGPSV
jgi:hypothetical protein